MKEITTDVSGSVAFRSQFFFLLFPFVLSICLFAAAAADRSNESQFMELSRSEPKHREESPSVTFLAGRRSLLLLRLG